MTARELGDRLDDLLGRHRGRGSPGGTDVPQPRHSGIGLAVFGLLAGLAFIGAAPELRDRLLAPRTDAPSRSYQSLVDRMIALNLLRVSGDEARIEINPTGIGAAERNPELKRELGQCPDGTMRSCQKMIEDFAGRSFLRGDMTDAASPVWTFENGFLLSTTPGSRRLVAGQVASDEARPQLKLAKETPTLELYDMRMGAYKDLKRYGRMLLPQQGEGTEIPQIRCFGAPRTQEWCQDRVMIGKVGTSLVMRLPKADSRRDISVEIDNSSVELDGQPRFLQLSENQRIHIRHDGYQADLRIVERRRRLADVPGLGSLAATLDNAATVDDVNTSLRRDVQAAAQALLDRQLKSASAKRAISFRATATLMDGWTGRVVAVPTFPYKADQLGSAPNEPSLRRSWLATNAAFTPMVVGSVAKVPFAAAILHAQDAAGKARYTAPVGRITSVGGYSLIDPSRRARAENSDAVGVENGHDGQSFDFREFIARSDNHYALALLAHAFHKRKNNARDLADVSDWSEAFWKLNCASTMVDKPLDGNRCPASLWSSVEVRHPRAMALAELPTLHFGFDDVEMNNRAYADYFINILGGGRSMWTSVGLAQSYSRIITRRQIMVTFMEDETRQPPPWLFGTVNGSNVERLSQYEPLLDGMANVVRSPRGTAHDLNALLAKRYADYDVYAKTGTFATETSADQDRYPCLRRHLSRGGALVATARGSNGAISLLSSSFSTNGSCARPDIAGELARLNSDPEQVAQLIAIADPQTLNIRRLPIFTSLRGGSGRALVLVLRHCRNPEHVRTISINIQDRSSHDSPAILYAQALLANDVIFRWITEGVKAGTQVGCARVRSPA